MLPLVSKTIPIESGASSLPNDTIFCSDLVFENLERILLETGHKPVQRIGHRDRNQHHVRVDPDIGAAAAARGSFRGLGARRDIDRVFLGSPAAEQAPRQPNSAADRERRSEQRWTIGTRRDRIWCFPFCMESSTSGSW